MLAPPARAWALDLDDLGDALGTDFERGLSATEASERLAEGGPNELEETPAESMWRRAVRQFRDPLVLLLLAAIVISTVAWVVDGTSEAPIEPIVIAAIVALNAVIGIWQEGKALAAVAALRRLASTHAVIVRDGVAVPRPTAELVIGDVITVAEGDAIGADCRLIEVASLEVAEAPITGESAPVGKTIGVLADDTELADRVNMVFSGTGVSRGRARAVVTATGSHSEIGRIASMLEGVGDDRTPLQRQIDWLGKMLAAVVVALAVIVMVAIALTSDISSVSDVVDVLLVGMSLAVAAVPEGLPAILSVVLALGVQRMAGHNAIVKRLSSVETLGSATVICTDKTGTLTRNEMTIVRVVTGSGAVEITGTGYDPFGEVRVGGHPVADARLLDEVHLVVGAGSLANDATLRTGSEGEWRADGDPTEAAFLVAEQKLGIIERRTERFQRVAEVPFDADRKLMTTIDRDAQARRPGGASELMQVTKGAPDVLIARCGHERVDGRVIPLTDDRRREILGGVEALADDALRTLGVAYRRIESLAEPVDESIERGLIHLGMVGIIDPPRASAADAIAEAHAAGIRVIMITGDHPRTAARIGQQLGIDGAADDLADTSVTGTDLAKMARAEITDAVRSHSVFARVTPADKLGIVEALQADGHVVAMTGDGVNDAPALKRADIGVAMGINGTEVSKEASDMILADDNFATILHAVREGREIFSDIRKFLRYLLASNTGEVAVVFFGVLAAGALGLTDATDGLAVPLLATQILWINLLTDSALALALGVDPAVEDVMEERPRPPDDRIVDRSMLVTIALVGTVTAAAALIAFDVELAGGMLGGSGDLATARTMAFTTIVLAQIFNAFNSRSDRVSAFVRPFENRLLWAAAAVTVALQIAVVHLPPLQRAFETEPLDAGRWFVCAGLASTVLFADELRKLIARLRRGRRAAKASPCAPSRNAGPRSDLCL
ncbi:MAG: HAD-IC family P-type ATPase [Acidimicrobiia bacterium]|nr:HAD-IC family P-type ATPase [Acidimicrobiia bacterium]